jgi:hypothetical protein
MALTSFIQSAGESYHMQAALDKKVVQTTKESSALVAFREKREIYVANKNGTTYKSLNCGGYFIEKCAPGSSAVFSARSIRPPDT